MSQMANLILICTFYKQLIQLTNFESNFVKKTLKLFDS